MVSIAPLIQNKGPRAVVIPRIVAPLLSGEVSGTIELLGTRISMLNTQRVAVMQPD